jgi:hypothetical protein
VLITSRGRYRRRWANYWLTPLENDLTASQRASGSGQPVSCKSRDYDQHDTARRERNHQAHRAFLPTGHISGKTGCDNEAFDGAAPDARGRDNAAAEASR